MCCEELVGGTLIVLLSVNNRETNIVINNGEEGLEFDLPIQRN